MRKQTTTIAFRVDKDLVREIDAQREPFGSSRGEWVRGIVITWLNLIQQNRQVAPADSATIDALGSKLEVISRNQAKSVYLLLTAIGNISQEDARALVKRQLLGEEDES